MERAGTVDSPAISMACKHQQVWRRRRGAHAGGGVACREPGLVRPADREAAGGLSGAVFDPSADWVSGGRRHGGATRSSRPWYGRCALERRPRRRCGSRTSPVCSRGSIGSSAFHATSRPRCSPLPPARIARSSPGRPRGAPGGATPVSMQRRRLTCSANGQWSCPWEGTARAGTGRSSRSAPLGAPPQLLWPRCRVLV